jgi:hypothetical protein
MAFQLTPNVQVRRDRDGRVRQLSHPAQPYQPEAVDLVARGMVDTLTPRALAEQYIRDVSDILGLAPAVTGNFAAGFSSSPSGAAEDLRFKEEKAVPGAATVSYNQTVFGLPIWEAGVAVRINTTPLQVTGSHNAVHYDVQVDRPPADAPYMPNRMDTRNVRKVLNLDAGSEPTVNATRLVIYKYTPAERIDPQVKAHEAAEDFTGLAGSGQVEFPTLPLPPVAPEIGADRHYIVTEVMFSLAHSNWGLLNWRAFVEPVTGSVLYLRALVSCATGSVFMADPVTVTGVLHSAADAAGVLDALRTSVPLMGLTGSSNGIPLELSGEFVKLVDVDAPGTPMPAEPSPFDFTYSCKTDDFAACNAYFHTDAVFRLIQGMGIDVASYFNNTDFPLPVDPHALGGQVNAQARGNVMGNGMGSFVFGVARQGEKLGIAADIRVVLHEFGHALLWDHVDWPNFGFAHSAGDSLAAILHDPETKAPDRFETFPFMKASAGLSRRHDRNVAAGWAWGGNRDDTQYGSEQILSTTLFRIYLAAGGASNDVAVRRWAARYVSYLIIKACGLLTFRTPDPDVFVSALIDADSTTTDFEGHPGGAFRKVIRWSFEKQGLYQPAGAPEPVSSAGAPPDVDLYINDGRNGDYVPFLEPFEGNAEIWNRLGADGHAAHQPPAIGALNHAYVTVRNRGTQAPSGITVRGYQARSGAGDVWPTDWKPMTTAVLHVPGTLAPGAQVKVGPFTWTPHIANQKVLFSVSASGDISNLETVTSGSILNSRLVRLENNLGQRAM